VTVTGKSFSLSFEDEVLVNFYYGVSDLTDVTEHGMLVFYTKPETVDLSVADDVYTDSVYVESLGCYMNTTKGIAAKEMGDTRYYVAYAKLQDGGCIYSAAYDYSPKKYSMNMLGKSSTSDKQKALCVAMLNYGAAAQEYFNYNTEDLANNRLTETHKGYATGAVECENARIKGTNYLGTRLILESNIKLQFAFKNVDATMTAKITFTDHYGETKTAEAPVELQDNTYMVTIYEIVVADGRQLVKVEVYDGNNVVAEVSDSIESFVARDTSGKELFPMLMRFSDSAYAYFH
jgi:hypothetical protein